MMKYEFAKGIKPQNWNFGSTGLTSFRHKDRRKWRFDWNFLHKSDVFNLEIQGATKPCKFGELNFRKTILFNNVNTFGTFRTITFLVQNLKYVPFWAKPPKVTCVCGLILHEGNQTV